MYLYLLRVFLEVARRRLFCDLSNHWEHEVVKTVNWCWNTEEIYISDSDLSSFLYVHNFESTMKKFDNIDKMPHVSHRKSQIKYPQFTFCLIIRWLEIHQSSNNFHSIIWKIYKISLLNPPSGLLALNTQLKI